MNYTLGSTIYLGPMQSWLLNYLATSLNSFTILGLCIIESDYSPIVDPWKNFDIDILKIDPTTSS